MGLQPERFTLVEDISTGAVVGMVQLVTLSQQGAGGSSSSSSSGSSSACDVELRSLVVAPAHR